MKTSAIAITLSLLATSPGYAQHGFWEPDARVLITSFLNARGIATDHRYVWVSTENGLVIYDAAFKRWLRPSTVQDGYPVHEVPGRVAYDVRLRELWLVTDAQKLYSWTDALQSWVQRFESELPRDVRSRLLRPNTVRDPAWEVLQSFVGRDASGRMWPLTAVEPAERSGTFWATTYGGNFAFADTRNLSSEPLVYGTISRGISALALDQSGNLYFGGDGADSRNGVTRADSTLQSWQQMESSPVGGPRRRINDMVATPFGLFVGAADGLFILHEGRWARVDGEVRALEAVGDRVWVGTRGTLGWIDSTRTYTRASFSTQTVNGLAARNDTLWVATQSGVYAYVAGIPQLVYSQPSGGIVAAANATLALSPRGVVKQTPAGWAEIPRNASLAAVGRLTTLKAAGDLVWFGGTNGLAEWNTTSDRWRYLSVPADIPEGPIHDFAFENYRLWVATPAGAMRLQWN